MKFDVVIGNPPYQETVSKSETNSHDLPIYPVFYDAAKMIAKKYCLISPARFLTNSGYTSKSWNKEMLDDSNIKIIDYYPISSDVFENTDIKGGVVIIMRDSTKEIGPIGFFTPNRTLTNITKKVLSKKNSNSLKDLLYVQTKLNLESVYMDYPKLKSMRPKSSLNDVRLGTDSFVLFKDLFSKDKTPEYSLEIFGLLPGNKRATRFINPKYVLKNDNSSTKVETFRVLIPAASGSGKIGETISTPVITHPGMGHTMSFRSLGSFSNINEAESLLKYIKTKFLRALLSSRKTTQHMPPNVFENIPLENFTIESDIDWTKSISEIDQQLYKKYNLSEEEINFIETNVKEME